MFSFVLGSFILWLGQLSIQSDDQSSVKSSFFSRHLQCVCWCCTNLTEIELSKFYVWQQPVLIVVKKKKFFCGSFHDKCFNNNLTLIWVGQFFRLFLTFAFCDNIDGCILLDFWKKTVRKVVIWQKENLCDSNWNNVCVSQVVCKVQTGIFRDFVGFWCCCYFLFFVIGFVNFNSNHVSIIVFPNILLHPKYRT